MNYTHPYISLDEEAFDALTQDAAEQLVDEGDYSEEEAIDNAIYLMEERVREYMRQAIRTDDFESAVDARAREIADYRSMQRDPDSYFTGSGVL